MQDYFLKQIKKYFMMISEGALDLCVNLIVMIMVARAGGDSALGIFSYLLSIYIFSGFFSEFGISKHLEREIALTTNKQVWYESLVKSFQTTFFLSLLCSVIIILSAVYDASLTRIEEKTAAYIIIGLTIPILNFNKLRTAILQGSGNHETAAKLKIQKRLIFLFSMFVLLMWKLSPSYLTLGFLFSEIGFMVIAVKKGVKLPQLKSVWNNISEFRHTIKKGYEFLFADEFLDLVLYLDFLILGIFVSSEKLGIYAEASVLARFFLVIPASIKPIFKKKYCELISQNKQQEAAIAVKKTTAILFFLHAVFALYILLYFPIIRQFLYHINGGQFLSFPVFAEIIPGLLYFSAITAQEPVYEAEKSVMLLQKMVLIVATVNLLLNLYFIPFAGYWGAAFSTMVSMLTYFFLFGRNLNRIYHVNKTSYICAGASVYLTYVLFQKMDITFIFSFWLIPVVLFLFFSIVNLFHFDS